MILIAWPIVLTTMNLTAAAKGYLSVMMCVMAYYSIAQSYNCTQVVGIFRSGGDTRFGLCLDVLSMGRFDSSRRGLRVSSALERPDRLCCFAQRRAD